MELDDKTYNRIVKLCEDGDGLVEQDLYEQALKKYYTALDLIPSPKTEWEASTWIYTAIGEAYYFNEEYENGKKSLYTALNCPDGIANPLILLRLGECLYECGELNKAKEYLLQAYMLEGNEIFEDEDDKYFELLKPII